MTFVRRFGALNVTRNATSKTWKFIATIAKKLSKLFREISIATTVLSLEETPEVMLMTAELIIEENPFLVPLDSEEHKIQVKAVISDMLSFAEQLLVNNEPSYKKITSLYAQARSWKKAIDAKRKELVEPLRKQTSAINDKAKELSDPLDAVIDVANAKANGYQRQLEEQKRQEDENLKAAAALFDAAEEIYIPPMEKTIRGDGAVAVTRTEKKFKVVDLSKVPLKYLTIDSKIVEQDIKLGIDSIPGIEIFEETTTQLRIR